MFEFNYSIRDIRISDLGEGIVCLGEGSGGKGAGKWGKGGGKWGKRGREVGVRGEGSGECLPPCPPPHIWKNTIDSTNFTSEGSLQEHLFGHVT